jgi:ubiquitin-like modifier-activating enzyme ATG7
MTEILFDKPQPLVSVDFWTELYKKKLNEIKLNTDEITVYSDTSIYLNDKSFIGKANSVKGTLINVNTIEDYQKIDRQHILNTYGSQMLNAITKGDAIKDPLILYNFYILTFADLKNYKFTYWFSHPAFVSDNPFVGQLYNFNDLSDDIRSLCAFYNDCPIYMIIKQDDKYITKSLSDGWRFRFNGNSYIVFSDISIGQHFGWALRNLLALLCSSNMNYVANIICLKCPDNQMVSANSTEYTNNVLLKVNIVKGTTFKIVGYSYNELDICGPKVCDLNQFLNPKQLMKDECDLNLKLMKWREWPDLNLDVVTETKCLILGSGTLGCAVARTLLGWGITHITMLDVGKVTYSNPLRQSLFEYEDCAQQKYKAIAAAERLLKISPTLEYCKGSVCHIPMPGHHIFDLDQTYTDFKELQKLVLEHDAIFTLTDSRESRWLPTVMCSAYSNKILINSALGFDTFLVMRSGKAYNGQKVGCYFCNDIALATNSQKNLTVDKQCTVTRSGVSNIASGLAVELLIAQLQNTEHNIPLPHQIRGSVSHFDQTIHNVPPFEHCIACSQQIIDAYLEHDFELIKHVSFYPQYLETLSGIDKLTQNIDPDQMVCTENM